MRIENRVQRVGEMSRGLKILARELNVPVIALSQLSRGVESPDRQAPDAVRSTRIGQSESEDADLVMFIYRDEYYFPRPRTSPGGRADHRQAPQWRPGDVTFQNEYPRFLGLQRAA
jgi:replicative DNA helicase